MSRLPPRVELGGRGQLLEEPLFLHGELGRHHDLRLGYQVAWLALGVGQAAAAQPQPPAARRSARDLHFRFPAGCVDGDGHAECGLPRGERQVDVGVAPAEQIVEVEVVTGSRVEPDLLIACSRGRAAPAPGARGARACAACRPCPGFRVHALRNPAEIGTERVVPAARVGIGQHVIGLGYLLESLLCGGILVDVGVIGTGELAVGPLDLILAGRPRHPQDLIEVARGGHQPGPVGCAATTTAAGRSWCSPSPYPGRNTRTTVPAGASASVTVATASCRAGSNVSPRSSRRGKPRPASTAIAWSRTARIPSTRALSAAPAWSSARSRLSR